MRFPLLALLVFPLPALADACEERLADLIGHDAVPEGAYLIHSTGMVSGLKTESLHHYLSSRHFLIEMIAPAGIPDTLHFDGGLYLAGPKGWTLSQQIDADQIERDGQALRATQAAGITSATCTTEQREGISFDVVAGTVAQSAPYDRDTQMRYVINTETGLLHEMSQVYGVSGMAGEVRFVYTPAPGLELPRP